MKVKDILNRVDKSPQFKDNVFIGDIAEKMFDLYDIQHQDKQDRLTAYYIANWYCTDTYVGSKVYFFDDEPVAISTRSGRKSSENFDWISMESYKRVYDYVLNFKNEEFENISILDLDEEFKETYKVEFYCQMFKHHKENALYQGNKVKIIDFNDSHYAGFNFDGQLFPETVLIKFEDKHTEWIQTKELDFKYNLIDK